MLDKLLSLSLSAPTTPASLPRRDQVARSNPPAMGLVRDLLPPVPDPGLRLAVPTRATQAGTAPKPAAMYGITRSVRGWKVQLKRSGVTLFKRFGFKMHQGEEAALLQARAWRDQMIKKHPPVLRRERAEILRRNNTSGIPGVTCRLDPDGKPMYWIVQTYIAPGTMLRSCFSVGRYGSEAKLLAIAERKEHLRQMTGLSVVHPREALLRSAAQRPLPADCPAPLAGREVVRSTNNSGVPGVSYRRCGPKDLGRWIAVSHAGSGKSLQQSFSVKKHGEEQAKALAIAQRQKQLKLLATRAKPCSA